MNAIASSQVQHSPEKELIDLIIDSIQDIKGKNIVKLDLRNLSEAPADYFIICEGDSSTQVKSISDNIYRRVKDELKIVPNHREGGSSAKWVCVDYFTTIVHIFYPEIRSFYDLEDLWIDAKRINYENI